MLKRFAVFGQPIRHSLSPKIHAAFARQCGISLRYGAVEVGPTEFPAVLARFHAEGGAGGNVTLPLKELAAQCASALSDAARRAGAVNTLIPRESGWLGDNTDGAGFLADLGRLGVRLSGQRVLILGAGGAVRGVVGPLLDAGVGALLIANRSLDRAEAMVAAFGDRRLRSLSLDELADQAAPQLLVNAISAGHLGASTDWPPAICGSQTAAYDLTYGAAAAGFLDWARGRGATLAEDGLGMLVEQAAESFLRWHGVRPDTSAVLADLRQVNRA